ncbi:hypothetical protein [Phocaeicola dorei]|uniref:hypothetical protein n=1 Tax=Phocaeicola dorei TaxID=357276 RepID=UPI0034A48302
MKGLNSRIIKVPVFRTKIEEEEINLFSIDREEMVRQACKKINDFNCSNNNKIILENSGKNYTSEIVKITATRKEMHGSPTVLIKMSAHKTNMGDGYIETSEKIPVTKEVKIGSDHHYIVMYPLITKGRTKYKRHWNVFVYDDPNKDSQEFIRMAKEMIKRVLCIKISNLKRNDFVEELKEIPIISNITANFQTVEYVNNQYDAEFKDYIVKGTILSKKQFDLRNLPTSKIVEMLNNDEDVTIKRKIVNIFAGKKEYKVSQIIKKDYQRAREKYSLLIESLFNESVSITDEEYAQKLYDEDFVIEKIESAIANYMS